MYLFYLIFVCLVGRTVDIGDINEFVTVIKCEVGDEISGINDNISIAPTEMCLNINSTTNSSTFGSSNSDSLDCVVCGDRATGRKK